MLNRDFSAWENSNRPDSLLSSKEVAKCFSKWDKQQELKWDLSYLCLGVVLSLSFCFFKEEQRKDTEEVHGRNEGEDEEDAGIGRERGRRFALNPSKGNRWKEKINKEDSWLKKMVEDDEDWKRLYKKKKK